MKFYITIQTDRTTTGSIYQIVNPNGFRTKDEALASIEEAGTIVKTPMPDSYDVATKNGIVNYLILEITIKP